MRPKTTARTLPPRMLMRARTLVSGKKWVGYYYNGRDAQGKRIEIPLGTDLIEAKRKWADYECRPTPTEAGLMKVVFDRYEREVVPGKARRTQKENLYALRNLRAVFDMAPIEAVTPQHLAQYRDHRTAKVSANREIAVFSHVWNMAREWGYTSRENPVRGVRKNKETPRDFYADSRTWDALMQVAAPELATAMRLAYLTGQRTADVLKMRTTDIQGDDLFVKQNKTTKALRIALTVDGQRSELGQLLDHLTMTLSERKVASLGLLVTLDGRNLTYNMLRNRFDEARVQAAQRVSAADPDFAKRIRQFQFRDIRAKSASDIDDARQASRLLGHHSESLTRRVYRRAGEKVIPTR